MFWRRRRSALMRVIFRIVRRGRTKTRRSRTMNGLFKSAILQSCKTYCYKLAIGCFGAGADRRRRALYSVLFGAGALRTRRSRTMNGLFKSAISQSCKTYCYKLAFKILQAAARRRYRKDAEAKSFSSEYINAIYIFIANAEIYMFAAQSVCGGVCASAGAKDGRPAAGAALTGRGVLMPHRGDRD